MRKAAAIMVICIAAAAGVSAHAEETGPRWDSVYSPLDFSVSLGVGLSYGLNLTAFPSVELIVASFKIDDYVPLDLGVSIRGLVSFVERKDDDDSWLWITAGGGPFGTLHLSFDNLRGHSMPFLENLDLYAALGIVYTYQYFSAADLPQSQLLPVIPVGIATVGGLNYFLLDWLALNLQGSFWSYMGTVKVGVVVKF